MADATADATRTDEVGRRIELTRELVARRGAAGVLFETRRNFAWATVGGENHVVLATETGIAPLLVTRDLAAVLAPINEAARIADDEVAGLPLEVVTLPWEEAPKAARHEAERIAGGEVLRDDDLEDELLPIRSVLTPLEHERLRHIGTETGRIMAAALAAVTPGHDENGLAAEAMAGLAEGGIRTPVVLLASDDRIERYRHPLPTARRIERRVMLVLVAERWGLHVSLTMFRELAEPDPELARRMQAAAAVERAMREGTVPGRTLGDVLEEALREYERQGFADEWRLHHQGGSAGYQARERIATRGDTTRIEPGMAFAWNPSITGGKAETTFYLDPDGGQVLVTPAGDASWMRPPA